MSKFDTLQDHEFRNDEWAAREREDYRRDTETLEEIAERIATTWIEDWDRDDDPLKAAIVSALRNERERCWREVTAKADEWRRQARQPGTKRNTLNQMAHGAAMAANVLREGKKNE